MALLVDKYRPKSLDALSYHKDLSTRLQALVRVSDLFDLDANRMIL